MKSRKIAFSFFAVVILAFSCLSISTPLLISDSYSIMEGTSINSVLPFWIYADEEPSLLKEARADTKNNSLQTPSQTKVTLKLFNAIPIKEVSVTTEERPMVYPSGECLGIKLYSDGIIVVGFGDFETDDGICVSPGAVSGVKNGDIIEEINGKRVSKITDFTNILDSSQGECTLGIKRDKKKIKINITPQKCKDGHMRIGTYVKNSIAGVGTMTYAKDGCFAALGHGISESGIVVPLKSASVYASEIIDIKKGQRGAPGEIIAAINEAMPMGECLKNSSNGVYGKLDGYTPKTELVPVSSSTEIKRGEASILCCVDQTHTPQEYRVEILSVNRFKKNKSKSFTIKVTDENLLRKTGGIIQGMSGSPILQNGKLIGAVTHVFVNDPTKGYGIFIENMLEEAEKIK